ncbi:OmpA family protein [Pseudomonas sp. NPDC087346]|uniref:OmpA family protein n=1 Tax=Pseudomonas sp. NPDC087346 TaxID=3364438 RepID=UPI00381FDD62
MKSDNTPLQHIEVIGHTDAIGSDSSNQALGLKRAQTVRRLLIEGGLPAASARSVGSREPVSGDCDGRDRRVVVRVDRHRRLINMKKGRRNSCTCFLPLIECRPASSEFHNGLCRNVAGLWLGCVGRGFSKDK